MPNEYRPIPVEEPGPGLRRLEDRVLQLETISRALTDQQEQLRAETRHEILALREQMRAFEGKVDEGTRLTGEKLDRLMGERAVVTGLITLVTSVLGTGAVHVALTMGTH